MKMRAASPFSIQRFDVSGPLLLRPLSRSDARGSFTEVFNRTALEEIGIPFEVVQDNESLSLKAGTVRGLHLQGIPALQAKLVRVLTGAVFDVALDVRPWSPSFGRHVAVTLDAASHAHFYIPPGFAHGFCTLTDNVRVSYKVDAPYAPEAELGVHWRDPVLCIDWPVEAGNAVLSRRDRTLPTLMNARAELMKALSPDALDGRGLVA